MKKWKILKSLTISIIIVFFIRLIIDMIQCINTSYPLLVMGIFVNSWIEYFSVECAFIFIIWGIPLLIDIVLLILSIKKLKNKM